eukprot:198305-Hanusia_phi.AAC.1
MVNRARAGLPTRAAANRTVYGTRSSLPGTRDPGPGTVSRAGGPGRAGRRRRAPVIKFSTMPVTVYWAGARPGQYYMTQVRRSW